MEQFGGSGTLTDCHFNKNFASEAGGLSIYEGQADLEACTFAANDAVGGGAIRLRTGKSSMTECVFDANTAQEGGAVSIELKHQQITFIACSFRGNSATSGGGALVVSGTPLSTNDRVTLTACVLSGNSASSAGGAVHAIEGDLTLSNCTVASNSAGSGGGVENGVESFIVDNCILWGNAPDQLIDPRGAAIVRFCDVQGGWPGVGNIDVDPLFLDADGADNDPQTAQDNDLRLDLDSPCVDAGDNGLVPPGFTTDADGNRRFINCTVDMGAFENQDADMPGDVTCDGSVNGADIISLISAWGACLPELPICPADVSPDGGDGVVNMDDLMAVLMNWGL
jgi:predicted outer membrane repeat protein